MNKIDYFDDQYWISRGSSKFLSYIGPPLSVGLREDQIKIFLSRRGAFGAIWNYDDDYTEVGPWYRTVCELSGYDISMINSKNTKKKIKKCLNNCAIRPIDIEALLPEVYRVYLQACTRYKNADILPEKKFCQDIQEKHKKGNYRAFGIFHEDRLIAYMTVVDFLEYAMGDIAAFDPVYSNYYPMYGLYYYVANHFVAEAGYNEFDRGSKPLLHETNIDDFLIKMEYRKKYCRLGVYFSVPVRIMLRLARMLRFVYKRILPKRFSVILDSLLVAQDIAKATYGNLGVSE